MTAVLLGCGNESVDRQTAPTSEGGSSVGIDSALTLFRAGLPPVRDLQDAERSIERLIQRLARAVERRDTTDLRRLVMSRAEFAYLYYPTSPYTRRPTLQEPGLAWFLHLQHSEKGATRLMTRYGQGLRIARNECTAPRVEGENRLWYDCVQRVIEHSDTATIRLFGGLIERNGRFKIFSFSNDL